MSIDTIGHFRSVRRAWQKMHGTKGGKRPRVVDRATTWDDKDPRKGWITVKGVPAVRLTYGGDGPSRPRKPSRRRCALWGVS